MHWAQICDGFLGRGLGGLRPPRTAWRRRHLRRMAPWLLTFLGALWLTEGARAQGSPATVPSATATPPVSTATATPTPTPAPASTPAAPTGTPEPTLSPTPPPTPTPAQPQPEPEPAPLLSEPVLGKTSPPPDPGLQDIAGLPLARLIDRSNVFSGLGSFRQLLPKYGFAAYVHGIAISNFALQSDADSPVLPEYPGPVLHSFGGEFSLFVGAELFDRVFAEAQFALDQDAEFHSDFAQLDLRIYRDYIIARAGRFFVPMGGLNIYPEPQYMFPWITPALFFGTVLPGEWGELGFQFHGRFTWGEGRGMSYALYIVNGLEQRADSPTDPITGGSLANMRDNLLDQSDGHKSIGLQWILEPYPGLVFGVSGYEGIYSVRDGYRIFIVDGHTGFRVGKFNVRGEFAATMQETESQLLLKLGGYGLLSYRFKYLEPQLMVDGIRMGGSPELDRIAASVGVSVFPFPTRVPTASVRIGYSARWNLDTGAFATHYGRIEIRVAF